MTGHLNGVAAQIEKDVPAALFLLCFAHCTNLYLQSIGRQCAPVWHALDFVMGISHLIRYSQMDISLFISSKPAFTLFNNYFKAIMPHFALQLSLLYSLIVLSCV